MTQPVNDPWAAASPVTHTAAPATREYSPAADYGQPASQDGGSSLGEGYQDKQSSLYGTTIETLPSLFTAQHAPGTRIKLKVTAKPKDVQSTCHPDNPASGGKRLPEYWCGPAGDRKPGIEAIDRITGRPNDPVLNLVISGDTAERDPQIEGDNGRRSWFITGSAKAPAGHVVGNEVLSARRALLDAMQLAGQSGVRLTCDADWIGKTIEVCRVRRVKPGVQTSKWFWQARVTAE